MSPPLPETSTTQVQSESTASFFGLLHSSGALLASMIYLGVTAMLVFAIVSMTGGHFVYTLDDPYIHLALAERIRGGLYGINAGEAASPSSSILWPLLFVPFARSNFISLMPLLLNLLLGVAVVWMIALCVHRAFGCGTLQPGPRLRLLVVLLVFTFNLPGLTLTGMEHVLQLLLSLCCAYAVLCLLDGKPAPRWTLLAAAVLPCVRYEGLLLTAAVVLALFGLRYRRAAVALAACSMIVPAAFSAFLLHLRLPAFPLSVLLKSSANLGTSGVIATALRTVIDTLRNPERAPELILTGVLACLAWRNRNSRPRLICTLVVLLAAAVQTTVGPNGWFYRYEISALAFTLLLAVAISLRTPGSEHFIENANQQSGFHRQPSGTLLAAIAGLAAVYMQPLLATPAAALGIYEQQFQIARLTRDFYPGPVAVNDLGLVSFNRKASQYTLDLYGLGSYESARTYPKDKTPAWLDAVAKEHGIGLAAVYPEWFPHGVPATWKAVGKLCSPQASVSSYSSRVMIYDTGIGDSARLEQAVSEFAKTLPRSATLDLHPGNSYSTCGNN